MKKYIYVRTDGIPAIVWCRENNVPQQTMRVYLDKGYLVDDACRLAEEAHKRKLKQKTIMYKGIPAHRYFDNSTYTYIKEKIAYGCTIKEALKLREYNKTHKPYITIHDIRKNNKWKELI